MASKKALAFLAASGIARVHTMRELTNFAAGYGDKRFSLPYHVIRMNVDRSGDSKSTVGWALTLDAALADARAQRNAHDDADYSRGGAESLRQNRSVWYVRDIRDGKIHRI